RVQLRVGPGDVRLRGLDLRMIGQCAFQREVFARWERVGPRSGLLQHARRRSYDAQIGKLGIPQAALLHSQVRIGKSESSFGLVEIGSPANATFAAHADLLVNALVDTQVVDSGGNRFLTAKYFQISPNYAEGNVLRRGRHSIRCRVDARLLAGHLALDREAVEQHLGQGERGIAAIDGRIA